ncbi:glycine--tRNA ligase [Microgenomates group bacterium RIFCSPLOWO2_01_FULL_47_10]|nr:MAG: glycine--tRNA ligase [Microgenomates group bacterium RIFCSPLOWO2_01_FULL_47_10]
MTTLNDIVSLSKRRGFIFPGSEIYGGLANTYDFGPLGVELLRNIQNYWWQYFVTSRHDMFGLDSAILMSPRVWEASGHTASFTDALIDCKECQTRTRADHLIEDFFAEKGNAKKVEGLRETDLTNLVTQEKIPCPKCGKSNWTNVRKFNLLFETSIGIVKEGESKAYLRGEIAQGMFVNFKNVLQSMRPKLPFGIAQSGKAFRNEITMGNFIFRTLEFNLAEFEYFFDPDKTKWEEIFADWKKDMHAFAVSLGLPAGKLSWRTHSDEERSHYSSQTEDLDYAFPFGTKEMFGLAYRGDYDLKNHMEKSGEDLRYTDPADNAHKFIPHVVEPTFGLNRIFLAVLSESYQTDGERVYLKLPHFLAPYTLAVFPLLSNRPELVGKAKAIFDALKGKFAVAWDDRGNIGKRYFAQDEIGTPFCVTVDFDTLDKDSVTVRFRDTAAQERVEVGKLAEYIAAKLT